MRQLDWYGLYGDSWQGEITPEAFSHPAKYSRALIRKIYQHMLESGWIKPGDKVVDPFGGVALGAYHALQNGLVWCGCELEPKFVKLGNENIDLWNGRYSQHFAKWGTAVLIQGDSRFLAQNIQGVMNGSVSSPPFSPPGNQPPSMRSHAPVRSKWVNEPDRPDNYGNQPGQLGAMSMKDNDLDAAITSPPFGAGETRNRSEFQGGEIASMMSRAYTQDKQGVMVGNLAHLVTKEEDFEAAVSSPPYVDAVNSGEGPGAYSPNQHDSHVNGHSYKNGGKYGDNNGQLGAMNGGGFEAAVSSSPFEASLSMDNVTNGRKELAKKLNIRTQDVSPVEMERIGKRNQEYGFTTGNVGNDTGETFWTAARQIVEQTYLVLKPGAYTAWVCGDFVRKGERVCFGRQWMELCTAVGFEPVEWAVAWKTEYKGNQLDIFGNDHERRVDRVSFFRRLANEKNPDNAILNEDVIFMRKPL